MPTDEDLEAERWARLLNHAAESRAHLQMIVWLLWLILLGMAVATWFIVRAINETPVF